MVKAWSWIWGKLWINAWSGGPAPRQGRLYHTYITQGHVGPSHNKQLIEMMK